RGDTSRAVPTTSLPTAAGSSGSEVSGSRLRIPMAPGACSPPPSPPTSLGERGSRKRSVRERRSSPRPSATPWPSATGSDRSVRDGRSSGNLAEVRIVVDARPAVFPQKTGVGFYTWHLLRLLPRIDPATTYVAWYLNAGAITGGPRRPLRELGAPNLVERGTPIPAGWF